MHRPVTALLPLLAGLALACSSPETPPAAETTSPPPPAAAPAGELAPVSSRQADPGASAGPAIVAPGAVFQLPAGWEWQTPTSSMRLAQAEVPGPAGPGQMTAFHFGPGGGGGVEANLQRWAGQVEPDPGSSTIRDSFDIGEFRVTWIEVTGTLKPSTMGMGPTDPRPGSRLLAAVVEGDQGPWFFKLTGPAETLAAERAAFVDMLKSVRRR